MKKIQLFGAAIATLLMFSCEKETETNVTTPETTNTRSISFEDMVPEDENTSFSRKDLGNTPILKLKKTITTNSEGATSTVDYSYNEAGKLAKTVASGGPQGEFIKEFLYANNTGITTIVSGPSDAPANQKSTVNFDYNGVILSQKSIPAIGVEMNFTTPNNGFLLTASNSFDNVTTKSDYRYDRFGNFYRETTTTKEGSTLLESGSRILRYTSNVMNPFISATTTPLEPQTNRYSIVQVLRNKGQGETGQLETSSTIIKAISGEVNENDYPVSTTFQEINRPSKGKTEISTFTVTYEYF